MIRSHSRIRPHEVPFCVGDYVNDVNFIAARAKVVCPTCLCAAIPPASVVRGEGAALQVRWLQLRIVKKGTGPGAHEDEAFVEFVTRFKFKNQASRSFPAAGTAAHGCCTVDFNIDRSSRSEAKCLQTSESFLSPRQHIYQDGSTGSFFTSYSQSTLAWQLGKASSHQAMELLHALTESTRTASTIYVSLLCRNPSNSCVELCSALYPACADTTLGGQAITVCVSDCFRLLSSCNHTVCSSVLASCIGSWARCILLTQPLHLVGWGWVCERGGGGVHCRITAG